MPTTTRGTPDRKSAVGFVPSAPMSSKFALPVAPAALVNRGQLIDRLSRDGGPPVVSIIAPVGYGKSTLLHQWADRAGAVAYVAIDDRDNDAVALVSAIATALDRIEPIDPDTMRLLASPGRSLEASLLPALVNAIWHRGTPTLLMLDDVHRLHDPASLDVLAFLLHRLPENLRLVIAARWTPPLPFARLRAAGRLLELGPADLAFDHDAARTMGTAMGVTVDADAVARLLDRTEGWPAATYLGLRSIGSANANGQRGTELRGTEASIADYIRFELLDPLDPETRTWLRRSSVLDTMTASLCDAALETTGSLSRLRTLERENLFVIGLGTHRDAYRYHHLLRDALRDELDEHEPDAARGVASRAAAWCAEHGEPGDAVDYALASGDLDLAERLVTRYAFAMHWTGRAATIDRWLDWFDSDAERQRRPAVAVLAGWIRALDGGTSDARRWLATAQRSDDPRKMPDGASRETWVALLRGYMAPNGLTALVADARQALAGIPESSPFRPGALLLAGFAEIAAGSLDSADAVLEETVVVAEARRAIPGLGLALGERALIALARGDTAAAARHVERGLAVVREAGMDEYVAGMTLHAAAARTALANGSVSDARRAIASVNRLRPRATAALPVPALHMRYETIRACIVLHEATAARTLMVEVWDILRQCPDLGTLSEQATELEEALASLRTSPAGPWTLTTAELRVLGYLPTHLTFKEIAERLYVSSHTIKTQAMAIYGKLDASSRREAIERAVEAGLLDPSVIRMPEALPAS